MEANSTEVKTIAIAVDPTEFAEYAFDCEYDVDGFAVCIPLLREPSGG